MRFICSLVFICLLLISYTLRVSPIILRPSAYKVVVSSCSSTTESKPTTSTDRLCHQRVQMRVLSSSTFTSHTTTKGYANFLRRSGRCRRILLLILFCFFCYWFNIFLLFWPKSIQSELDTFFIEFFYLFVFYLIMFCLSFSSSSVFAFSLFRALS